MKSVPDVNQKRTYNVVFQYFFFCMTYLGSTRRLNSAPSLSLSAAWACQKRLLLLSVSCWKKTMRVFASPVLTSLRLPVNLILLAVLFATSQGLWSDVGESFEEEEARKVAFLSKIAYCADEAIDWTCSSCRTFPAVRNVSIFEGKSRYIRGFIGVDYGVKSKGVVAVHEEPYVTSISGQETPQDEATRPTLVGPDDSPRRYQRNEAREVEASPTPRIIIAFAGTDPSSIRNIWDDIEVRSVRKTYGGQCDKCKVHQGFIASYRTVKDEIHSTVDAHLRDNPTASVLLTGHSLGGALSILCMLDLRLTFGSRISFEPLYTYGSPRVGNADFAEYCSSIEVPIFRVVHYRDPVPRLPLPSWGYVHSPLEVYYDEPMTSYVICDGSGEDPKCSDQYSFISDLVHINDHLTYLTVDYLTSYLKCVVGVNDDTASNEGEEAEEEEIGYYDARIW